jgi:elongation factor P
MHLKRMQKMFLKSNHSLTRKMMRFGRAAFAAPRHWLKTSSRAFQLPVNQLKRGEVISHKGRLWAIMGFTHHSQGRGGSHYKLELKDLKSGSKGLERFNAGSVLEGVDLEEKKLDFMYATEESIHTIDPTSFEEYQFPIDVLEGDF